MTNFPLQESDMQFWTTPSTVRNVRYVQYHEVFCTLW